MVVEGTLRQSHALADPVQGQRRGAEGRDHAQPFVEPVVPAGTGARRCCGHPSAPRARRFRRGISCRVVRRFQVPLWLRCGGGLAASIGRAQRDEPRHHETDGAGQQGSLEPGGERLREWGVSGQQVAGAAGRDPAEDRQAERGPELERGGDQGRGQSGLMLRHARVRGRLHTGIQQPQPGPHDHQRGEQVAEIGAIHRWE